MPDFIRTVTKRSGKTVPYNSKKICKAITAANKDADNEMSESLIMSVALQVDLALKKKRNVTVEEIQDTIENALMQNNFCNTAREFIKYRQVHEQRRKAFNQLMESYKDIFFTKSEKADFKRDNANINADSSMGIMLKLGTEGAKRFVDEYVIPKKVVEAEREGWLHLHDKDFSIITSNCMQHDLAKSLKNGFCTGHGYVREPNSIRAAASLACILIQAAQNDFFGGQSISSMDWALAPYVAKSFKKYFKKAVGDFKKIAKIERKDTLSPERIDRYDIRYAEEGTDKYKEELKKVKDLFLGASFETDNEYITADIPKTIYDIAIENTVDETYQAMEALIHNLNTLHSRAGSQTPFSSVNFGMCTSPEGRLIIREFLNSAYRGLGNGETPIFPISIFTLKSGINYNPGDPNYDLFQLACKVSAKRLFPNFSNQDAPYNLKYYKENDPNTIICHMGCRTRVVSNVNGPEINTSRGNFAFVTLNLPKIAIEAKKDMDKFWKLYDKYINLSKEYLEHRFEIIAKKHVYNFPFAFGQKLYMGSEKLKQNDEIREALKNASLSIGFCGLAECLIALTGKHHGESKESQKLGLEIVGHLRDMTDKFTEKTGMNWSTFATPENSWALVA